MDNMIHNQYFYFIPNMYNVHFVEKCTEAKDMVVAQELL